MVINRPKIDTHIYLPANLSPDLKDRGLRPKSPENVQPLIAYKNSLSGYGIKGAIALTGRNSEDETASLIKYISTEPFIKGIIGWTDLLADDLPEKLDSYQKFISVKGFTHVLDKNSSCDLLSLPGFIRGVKVLKVYNYPFDLLISSKELGKVVDFAGSLPGVKIALTQTGRVLSEAHAKTKEWKAIISELSFSPELYFKLSPEYLSADTGKPSGSMENYLTMLFSLIGPDRIMYGSGWPTFGADSDIRKKSLPFSGYIESFGSEVADKIFFRNAFEFYKLRD